MAMYLYGMAKSTPESPSLAFQLRGTFTSGPLSAVRSIAMATWQRPLLQNGRIRVTTTVTFVYGNFRPSAQ